MNFESLSIDFSCQERTIIIAEVGVNHNCDMNLARELVDQAESCGADIVKFQAFVAEEEISKFAEKAAYQKDTTGESGGQLDMAKALELSHDQLTEIKRYCDGKNMPFLCTAFDHPSLEFLVNGLGVKALKIASSEVTNHPFLQDVARTGVGIILSTGASSLTEVEDAISAIREVGDNELVVLHCVSNYPADHSQLNLSAIEQMRKHFDLPIGYSDHSSGTLAPVVAASMGAVLVEKHFTLDRTMEGPDHNASIEPVELKTIVESVKMACLMRGDGVKRCVPCEEENKALIRKSLVVSRFMKKGEVLSEKDLKFKRPASGIPPYDLLKVVGQRLMHDVEEDQALEWSMIDGC